MGAGTLHPESTLGSTSRRTLIVDDVTEATVVCIFNVISKHI